MTDRYLTPAQLAERWQTTAPKVLALIHSGRLAAISISPPTCQRPRYRIPPAALAEYESQHTSRPPVKPPSRRKRMAGVIEFYR
jgi:hypothetical protein